MVAERIQHIEQRIATACQRVGRRREDVVLVAVSKTQSAEITNEALRCGITDLGENRVQEYLAKREALDPHRFHMIGHLQRNKVKFVVGQAVLIHSVDSLEVAAEIDKRSAALGVKTDILLEVNSSGEKSKFGLSPEEVEQISSQILMLKNIQLRGLMCIAAFLDEPELLRPEFRVMRELRDHLATEFPHAPITELSMGMTNDYEVAIEEGATIVRIGSAIFGPRV